VIIPPILKQNSQVRIVSTARSIADFQLHAAIKTMESWGYRVSLGDNLFLVKNQFAGDEKARIFDLQQAINDVNVDAILFARGGYGTVKIIDEIDFKPLKENPKWFIGYSDITVLHNHLHENDKIASLHASMPINFDKNTPEALNSIKNCLSGVENSIEIQSNPQNIKGNASGMLVGGNLSILYSLLGSNSDINTAGKILFIEDLDEYLYHLDRMMINMKRNHKLKDLKGLIVGGFSDMRDNEVPFGKNATEIILDAVKEYDFPVIFDFPAGHLDDNRAIILGKNCEIQVSADKATFIQ